MSTVDMKYQHIVMDSHNRPVIEGTRMKVTQLVMEKQAYGWSPEELQYQLEQNLKQSKLREKLRSRGA